MQFKHAYDGWTQKRLTQEEAALLLNVCPRTFWRYINRFEEDGMDGLIVVLQKQAIRFAMRQTK